MPGPGLTHRRRSHGYRKAWLLMISWWPQSRRLLLVLPSRRLSCRVAILNNTPHQKQVWPHLARRHLTGFLLAPQVPDFFLSVSPPHRAQCIQLQVTSGCICLGFCLFFPLSGSGTLWRDGSSTPGTHLPPLVPPFLPPPTAAMMAQSMKAVTPLPTHPLLSFPGWLNCVRSLSPFSETKLFFLHL